jgi:hypothetical protein
MSTHLNQSRDTKEMVSVLLALMHIVKEVLATYTTHSLILVIIAGDLKEVLAMVYLRTLLLVMVLFHPPITMVFLLYTPPTCQQIHCPPLHQYLIQPTGIPTIGIMVHFKVISL